MKLFLDTSVILAACISPTGASRFICEHADQNGWSLLASPYVVAEVMRNLAGRPASLQGYWQKLRASQALVPDVLAIPMPVVFPASKDKPVLFSAYAAAEILLTLDANDFVSILSGRFYGLRVLKSADFLIEQRKAGKISTP